MDTDQRPVADPDAALNHPLMCDSDAAVALYRTWSGDRVVEALTGSRSLDSHVIETTTTVAVHLAARRRDRVTIAVDGDLNDVDSTFHQLYDNVTLACGGRAGRWPTIARFPSGGWVRVVNVSPVVGGVHFLPPLHPQSGSGSVVLAVMPGPWHTRWFEPHTRWVSQVVLVGQSTAVCEPGHQVDRSDIPIDVVLAGGIE